MQKIILIVFGLTVCINVEFKKQENFRNKFFENRKNSYEIWQKGE